MKAISKAVRYPKDNSHGCNYEVLRRPIAQGCHGNTSGTRKSVQFYTLLFFSLCVCVFEAIFNKHYISTLCHKQHVSPLALLSLFFRFAWPTTNTTGWIGAVYSWKWVCMSIENNNKCGWMKNITCSDLWLMQINLHV